jgi:hypothetical protein
MQNAVKARAQATLSDSLGAVAAALASMPDNVVKMPRNTSEAFMLVDPVLSTLNKQILDARANLAQLVVMFGAGDAMVEALTYQLSALEAAYAQRLAALRKKREETSRGQKDKEITAIEKNLRDVRSQTLAQRRRNNGALWLLAVLILRDGQTSAKKGFGHVLNAA